MTDTSAETSSLSQKVRILEIAVHDLSSAAIRADQVEVLARLGVWMAFGMQPWTRTRKREPLDLFHLELAQAYCLTAPRRVGQTDGSDPFADTAQTLSHLAKRAGHAFIDLHRAKGLASSSPERGELIWLMQGATLAVRSARHLHQTQEATRWIAGRLDRSFASTHSVSASQFLDTIDTVVTFVEARFKVFLDRLKTWFRKSTANAMIEAFVAGLPDAEAEAIREAHPRATRSAKSVHRDLFVRSEAEYVALFSFSIDDVCAAGADKDRMMAILDLFAHAFGDLRIEDLKHVHLANPVRGRPLIRLEAGVYFCCLPQGLAADMVESLGRLCAETAPLKKRFEKAKADWLEHKLHSVVVAAFPNADVRHTVKRKDHIDHEERESDVVALIDKTVIIFEAKSGGIDPAALRGAAHSLKGDLSKLLVEPSRQSLRLKQHIESAVAPIALMTASGPLEIDPKFVRNIVRVNILFDTLGPLSAHWPKLKAAGLIPVDEDMAPSMSVFELETVFEALTLQSERCHYLTRRTEIERSARYIADELDLLAFYLETQFNIGEAEFSARDLTLYGKSQAVAVGYSERRAAGTLSFPIPRVAPWRDVLAMLEEQRPVGWTRFAHRLHSVPYDGQREVERGLRRGFAQVARAPGHFFTTGYTVGPVDRRHCLSILIGAPTQLDHDLRYAAETACEQSGQDDVMVLYWQVPRTENALDFIGVLRRTNLSHDVAPGTVSVGRIDH